MCPAHPDLRSTGASVILRPVEQKQSEANLPPIGAAADPALIPGLTVPSSRTGSAAPGTEPEEAPEARPGAPAPDAEPADAAPAPGTTSDAEPETAGTESRTKADAEPEAATPAEATADDKTPDTDTAPAPDVAADSDPDGADASATADDDSRAEAEFTAADRRGSVTLDREGVRYALDDQACEWTWSEVAAVEYGTSRMGRRLTVTVHTPDERWYPHDVQAPDKATLSRWTEELDAALDAHFEE